MQQSRSHRNHVLNVGRERLGIRSRIIAIRHGKLSPSERDDPRNSYTITDKTALQNRYNEILQIEKAVREALRRGVIRESGGGI